MNCLKNHLPFFLCLQLFSLITTSLIGQNQATEEILVRQTLNYYLDGGTNNDFATLKKAFHPTATMKFIKGSDNYQEVNALAFFEKGMKPGPPQDRQTQIEYIDLIGNAAHAKLIIDYPSFRFIDFMNLLKVDNEWKIMGKIFYKEDKIPTNDLKTAALDLLDRWVKAYLNQDVATLENILAATYLYQGAEGKTVAKKALIEDFKKSTARFKDIQMEDLAVRTFGNTAIITGKEKLVLEEAGKTTTLQLSFTDVYTMIDGRLQAISTQSAPLEIVQ